MFGLCASFIFDFSVLCLYFGLVPLLIGVMKCFFLFVSTHVGSSVPLSTLGHFSFGLFFIVGRFFRQMIFSLKILGNLASFNCIFASHIKVYNKEKIIQQHGQFFRRKFSQRNGKNEKISKTRNTKNLSFSKINFDAVPGKRRSRSSTLPRPFFVLFFLFLFVLAEKVFGQEILGAELKKRSRRSSTSGYT